jgi:hypothetical protein
VCSVALHDTRVRSSDRSVAASNPRSSGAAASTSRKETVSGGSPSTYTLNYQTAKRFVWAFACKFGYTIDQQNGQMDVNSELCTIVLAQGRCIGTGVGTSERRARHAAVVDAATYLLQHDLSLRDVIPLDGLLAPTASSPTASPAQSPPKSSSARVDALERAMDFEARQIVERRSTKDRRRGHVRGDYPMLAKLAVDSHGKQMTAERVVLCQETKFCPPNPSQADTSSPALSWDIQQWRKPQLETRGAIGGIHLGTPSSYEQVQEHEGEWTPPRRVRAKAGVDRYWDGARRTQYGTHGRHSMVESWQMHAVSHTISRHESRLARRSHDDRLGSLHINSVLLPSTSQVRTGNRSPTHLTAPTRMAPGLVTSKSKVVGKY